MGEIQPFEHTDMQNDWWMSGSARHTQSSPQGGPQGNPIKWSQNTHCKKYSFRAKLTQAGDAPISALPKQGLQYSSILSSVTSVHI